MSSCLFVSTYTAFILLPPFSERSFARYSSSTNLREFQSIVHVEDGLQISQRPRKEKNFNTSPNLINQNIGNPDLE